MKGHRFRLICTLLLTTLFMTGCWDRTELSDLAFVMGFGMDKEGDQYLATIQFANPAVFQTGQSGGGGGDGKGESIVESAKGSNIQDATGHLQEKVSRQINPGQRRVIFIGESLAKDGIKDLLDEYTRNPDVRMRTDIYEVKAGEAKDVLQLDYPFERVPTLAALKIHRIAIGRGETTLRDFLISESDETSNPVLPVIGMVSETSQMEGEKTGTTKFRFAGNAIFGKDLKLIGYLNTEEATDRSWITNEINTKRETVYVSQGGGSATVNLHKLSAKVTPSFHAGNLAFKVVLYGSGDVMENETGLDLTRPQNMKLVQEAFENQIEQRVEKSIQHVQKDYRADVYEFGEAIHRRNPKAWKRLQRNWDTNFQRAHVQVDANLTLQRVGLSKSALQKHAGGTQ